MYKAIQTYQYAHSKLVLGKIYLMYVAGQCGMVTWSTLQVELLLHLPYIKVTSWL